MSEKYYFTRRGLAKMNRKIEELKKKLADLQSQIAYVAEHCGDSWHDNPTYNSLILDIRALNRSINDARHTLDRATIVELPTTFDRVVIGTRVRILCDGEEMTWKIVGFDESNPDRDMIAYNTPFASLIMGKSKGEVLSGTIAGRQTEIEVLEITEGGEEDVRNS